MKRVGIVDYDAGNVASLSGALDELGCAWSMVSNAEDVETLARGGEGVLVLPGVGAFGAAMASLDSKELSGPIRSWLARGLPFIGICLGLQLLYEGSEEDPGVAGLGFLPGKCERFRGALKVPCIGWNLVKPAPGDASPFEPGAEEWFYFVHSYHAPVASPCVIASTDYGYDFPCAIRKGRAVAFQFHPEKSSRAGLALLKRAIGS